MSTDGHFEGLPQFAKNLQKKIDGRNDDDDQFAKNLMVEMTTMINLPKN